jgi:predicted cupin superfamily sugar epimerase
MSLDLPTTIEDVVEFLELIPHPEGGFFREIYRSGAIPMTSRGQTDFTVPDHHLVRTTGRENRRDDDRRNALTAIYWMPTSKSPHLPLSLNQSTHVHNYHGGLPFQYALYDPTTQTVTTTVLGPNLREGHRPQVIVEGGIWKTGTLLTDYSTKYSYCLLGESVAPGFDVADFQTMSSDQFQRLPIRIQEQLGPYVTSTIDKTNAQIEFDSHYDDDEEQRTKRVEERL